MKLRSFARASFVVVGLALVACGGGSNEDEKLPPKDCAMSLGSSSFPRGISGPLSYSVKYEVTGSGEGTIKRISYRNGGSSAPVVVENPVLPWAETVTVYSGSSAAIELEGSVTNGRFEMKYNAVATSSSGGSSAYEASGSKVCEQTQSSSTTMN